MWEKDVEHRRQQRARESLAVEVPGKDCSLHQYQTFEFAHALDEKLGQSRNSLARYAKWDTLEGLSDEVASEALESVVGDPEENEAPEVRRSGRVSMTACLNCRLYICIQVSPLGTPGAALVRTSQEETEDGAAS